MAIYSGFSHKKWWFSIAMINYQMVSRCRTDQTNHRFPKKKMPRDLGHVRIVDHLLPGRLSLRLKAVLGGILMVTGWRFIPLKNIWYFNVVHWFSSIPTMIIFTVYIYIYRIIYRCIIGLGQPHWWKLDCCMLRCDSMQLLWCSSTGG